MINTKTSNNNSSQISNQKTDDEIFNVINISVFVIFTLICILPFYYLFINTISDNDLVSKNLITLWPKGIHFDNYIDLINVGPFFQSVYVTLARTVLGTASMVLVSSFTAYLVSKTNMWKRRLWYRMIIIPMYFNAGLIPWYLTMMNLGLTDNFFGYIIPGLIAPFYIILIKTYIESVPKDIEESAKVDGAGILTIYWKITMPLCVPVLATISIFGAVGNWNSMQDSLLLMQSRTDLYTLQHVLYTYLQDSKSLQSDMQQGGSVIKDTRIVQYTISMVSVIPIMLVYPLMQRFFIKGMMLGAVKG